MGSCDLCNAPIPSSAKRYTPTQFRRAVGGGLRQAEAADLLMSALGHSEAMRRGWVNMAMNSTTDWAVCSTCAERVDSFLRDANQPAEATPASAFEPSKPARAAPADSFQTIGAQMVESFMNAAIPGRSSLPKEKNHWLGVVIGAGALSVILGAVFFLVLRNRQAQDDALVRATIEAEWERHEAQKAKAEAEKATAEAKEKEAEALEAQKRAATAEVKESRKKGNSKVPGRETVNGKAAAAFAVGPAMSPPAPKRRSKASNDLDDLLNSEPVRPGSVQHESKPSRNLDELLKSFK
jgi:hypothetical protein